MDYGLTAVGLAGGSAEAKTRFPGNVRLYRSGHSDGAVVVAVFSVRVVQVASDDEVDVVAVRDALVAATGLVGVASTVFGTVMRWRAAAWIQAGRGDLVLVDVPAVRVVKVTVVKVVGVSLVGDRTVTASIPMCVLMSGVLTASH